MSAESQIEETSTPVPEQVVPAAEERFSYTRQVMRGFSGLGSAMVSIPAGLLGLVAVIVGAVMPVHGLGPSYCGMQKMLNVPCPGCGLTRSVASFFHGEFSYSWHYHPLGPGFALLFGFMALTLFLPRRARQRLSDFIGRNERAVAIAFLTFCIALLIYGVFRIIMIKSGAESFAWWENNGQQLPPFARD